MADVFLSYASEDRDLVRPVVNYLEGRGWSVWWDRSLRAGETWPESIEQELKRAHSVVVAWSVKSVESPWVRLEAHTAHERNNLVPVVLDDVPIPAEFSLFQAVDLRQQTEDGLELVADAVSTHLKRHIRRVIAAIVASSTLLFTLFGFGACLWMEACVIPASSAVPESSLAIMSFENLVQEKDLNQIAEAFSDELRNGISKINGHIVSSKAAVLTIPGEMSPIEIASRLKVRWLLKGSIVGEQNNLKFSIELIEGNTGYLKGSKNYNTSLGGLIETQSRMRGDILNLMGSHGAALVSSSVSSRNEAYVLYLRGKAAIFESTDEAQLLKAENLFKAGLILQPGYVLAEVGLCQVSMKRYQMTRGVEHFKRGEVHCNRALDSHEYFPDAAVALGWLYFHEGEYNQSREFFSKALLTNIAMAEARIGLGNLDSMLGQHQNAEENFRLAIELQPGSWRGYNQMGNFYYETGRGAEAIAQHNSAIELMSVDAVGLNNLGASYLMAGQFNAALTAWEAARKIQEQAPTYSNLGVVHYNLGNYAAASEMYKEAAKLQPEDYRYWSNLGDAYLQMDGGKHIEAYTKANRLLDDELTLNINNGAAYLGRAAVHAALGKHREALDGIDRGLKNSSLTWETAYLVALTYSRLGEDSKVVHHLSIAIENGYPQLFVERDPAFARFHGKEEFDQLIEKGTR